MRANDGARRSASILANVGAFGFQFLGHFIPP